MDRIAWSFSNEEHMSTAMLSNVGRGPLTEELDQVFREHHQLVYRTAYGVTGSHEDAQDVLQTIVLRLLRCEFPPDLRSNPKAYLYRAAVNLSLSTIRNRKRRPTRDIEGHLDQPPQTSSADSTDELHGFLYRAISELESEPAQVLVLRYVHGYKIAEIARLWEHRKASLRCACFEPEFASRNSFVLFRRRTHETAIKADRKDSR
jgi:RNA polymerase sigma-70 factor, ECF subfamily